MKKFFKVSLFALAMSFVMCVQAENKPENGVLTVEPNDVQKPKCVVSMTICGVTHVLYVGDFSDKDCKKIQESHTIMGDLFTATFGCF